MSGWRLELFSDAEELAIAAADRIARCARDAASVDAPFHIALAGGSTPRRCYELLVERDLPWSAIHLWFSDERCVAPDHPDSNFGMVERALLRHVALPAANVHRMEGEAVDREAAALRYEALLPMRLDLLLLGLGPDGHTASLFPGSPALRETVRRVLPVVGSKPPPQRLTFTPVVIRAAHEVVVLAAGAEKAVAVRRALVDAVDPDECPAMLLRAASWMLDRAAAAEIPD